MRRDFVEAVVELIALGLNAAARERYEHHHPGIQRIRTYLGMLDQAPLIEVWPSLSRTDFRPALARIDVPALLVYGTESNYYPPATGTWVRDSIAGAQLLLYQGADHSPHVNQPDRFAADLIRFAGERERPSHRRPPGR
jgi:pimeloyl-ACP methyl ester carboxylesterase